MSPWGFTVLFSLLSCVFENCHCEPLKRRKKQREKTSLHITGQKMTETLPSLELRHGGIGPSPCLYSPTLLTASGAIPPPPQLLPLSPELSLSLETSLPSQAAVLRPSQPWRAAAEQSKGGREILPDPKYPADLCTTQWPLTPALPLLSRVVPPKSCY